MSSPDDGAPSIVPGHSPFAVVALVASAGGVEAISALVRHLPADFPLAVIVVLHLSPGNNHMVEIFARYTELPVQWATQYEALQPGRVYVCPPRQILQVQPDRTCDLEPYDAIAQARPISAFLRSLAESYGPHALAVILSGMWKDGVEGIQALKASGGTVLVQSEESALQPEMPRAAIETGVIDLVVPLQELRHLIPSIVASGRLPRPYSEIEAVSALFRGHDETSSHLREVEWERTAFGPVSRWPASLAATVRLMMDTDVAMALFWGPDLRLLYNDAYRPMLMPYPQLQYPQSGSKHEQGVLTSQSAPPLEQAYRSEPKGSSDFTSVSNHPQAIGLPAHEVYRDIWQDLAPLYQQVYISGETVHRDDQCWTRLRDGRVDDVYASSHYSPLRDEKGMVRGVLLTIIETTRHVLAERRATTLRRLAALGLRTRHQREVCEQALQTLEQNPDDVPFALLYLLDHLRVTLRLAGATGLEAGTYAAPHVVSLGEGNPIWPLATVLEQGKSLLLNDLSMRIRGLSIDSQVQSPSTAILLPLKPATDDQIMGILIVGLSAHGIFDTSYQEFLELVAAQVASGFAAAGAAQRDAERMQALTALDRAKTDFFSNISHEFRTPLTLLLGPLENVLKQQEQLSSAMLDDLQLVQRNASQLHKLVNTLLDFSRIEAKRTRLNPQPTDLAALTQDLASLFRSAVEQAGLTFIVDCPPLPALVSVDRKMWEKIVLNLLSNALKFTFSGSISLSMRALPQHIELIVADTGVGIPVEEQPHLFQRFHRIAGVRARTQQGSGIGLALVQEYTRLHGGRVRVRSQVEDGTTFTIWIPTTRHIRDNHRDNAPAAIPAVATAEAQHYAEEAMRWVQQEATTPSTSQVLDADLGDEQPPLPMFVPHALVLVVEDHADMRIYLQRLLSQHWLVQVATNGREALDLAQSSPPALILADVMMPEMDGFALLRHVRADERLKTIPFLLMTARAGEEAAIEGLLAGADDYVIKPFSAHELLARISAQLELSRVRREGEKRVQAERQRLYDLFMNAPAAIVVYRGPEHIIELINPEAYQMFGTHRSLVGKTIREGFPELEGQGYVEPLDIVYQTGKPFVSKEYPLILDRDTDGQAEVIYANFIFQPSYSDTGEVDAVISFAYDVTELVQARKQAEESEKWQAFLLKLNDVLGPISDPVTIVGTATRTALEYFGADRCYYCEIEDGNAVVRRDAFRDGLFSLAGVYPIAQYALYQNALDAGRPIIVNDVHTADVIDEQSRALCMQLQIHAFVNVPVIKNGEPVGILALVQNTPRVWTDLEIASMVSSSERIWAAIKRVQAEEALQRSERRLQLATDAAKIGTFMYYPDEDRGDPDTQMLALYGLPPDDTLNLAKALGEIIHPDDRERYAHEVAQALHPSSGGKLYSDIRIIHPDGSLHWMNVTGQVQFEGDPPRAVSMSGVSTDITEHKRSAERKAYLLSLSDALHHLTDATEIRETACRVLGEHLKVTRVMCAAHVLQNGREYYQTVGQYTLDRPFPSQPLSVEDYQVGAAPLFEGKVSVVHDVMKDIPAEEQGVYVQYNTRSCIVAPVFKKGPQPVLLFAVHDNKPRKWREEEITLVEETAERTWEAVERAQVKEALRKAEERLRIAAEASSMYWWEFNFRTNTTRYSSNTEQVIGAPPAKTLEENLLLLHPDDKDVPARAFEEAIHNGTDHFQYVVRSIAVPSKIQWLHVSGKILRDNQNNPLLAIGMSQDITERKRAEEAIQEAL